jgi:hypothetical protein
MQKYFSSVFGSNENLKICFFQKMTLYLLFAGVVEVGNEAAGCSCIMMDESTLAFDLMKNGVLVEIVGE